MNAITSPARLFNKNRSGDNNTIWALKDVSVISTDHSSYDYDFIVKNSRLVVDTRNAMKEVYGFAKGKIIKA
jgi:UDP-N-acetyl-D-mannosaminuronate dehydrogenase